MPYPIEIDFNKRSLIVLEYSGTDCLSTFQFGWKIESPKEYTLTIIVNDGGCRSGGYLYVWLASVPVLPENVKINKKVLSLD